MGHGNEIQRIKDRYFRKVIAHPDGAIVHFGDCWWYACQICNCGLHSDLIWIQEEAEELYPKFWEENAISDARREQLYELPIPKIEPLTEEEAKKAYAELMKIFTNPNNRPATVCGVRLTLDEISTLRSAMLSAEHVPFKNKPDFNTFEKCYKYLKDKSEAIKAKKAEEAKKEDSIVEFTLEEITQIVNSCRAFQTEFGGNAKTYTNRTPEEVEAVLANLAHMLKAYE
jgi:hypothetical protein